MVDKKAIVIGASTGIGKELAKLLAQEGYVVGIASRKFDRLQALAAELKGKVYVRPLDVSQTEAAMSILRALIREMGDVELIIVNAGIGYINPDLLWTYEKETLDVNVSGFTAMVNVAMQHFLNQGRGHLVGISSIAALRGSSGAPAYNASKAFLSNYLEGMRSKAAKSGLPIIVTDVKPGFVDTAMAKGSPLFWVASPETAAKQILAAIHKKRRHVYITKRWRLVAWLLKLIPGFIYEKL